MTGVQYWVRVGVMILIAALEYELASLWLIVYGVEWVLSLVPAIMWIFVDNSATQQYNTTFKWMNFISQIWLWGFYIVHIYWDALMIEPNNTQVYSIPYLPYVIGSDLVIHTVLLVLYYVGYKRTYTYINEL